MRKKIVKIEIYKNQKLDTLQDTFNEEDSEIRRGRGRPKLLKTGQPGRPRKIYQKGNTKIPDPETVPDALSGNNSEA